MVTHFSILAWDIPQTEEPGGPPSTVLPRVGNDHSDLVSIEARLFFPVGTLSQRRLSVNMAQLLGLWGPWRRQVCRDPDCLTSGVMALSASFLKPLVVGCQKASLASLSP